MQIDRYTQHHKINMLIEYGLKSTGMVLTFSNTKHSLLVHGKIAGFSKIFP